MIGVQYNPAMSIRQPAHPHYLVWIEFNDRQRNHVRYGCNADNSRREWCLREEFTLYGRAWSYSDIPLGIWGMGAGSRAGAESRAMDILRAHFAPLFDGETS